MALIIYLNLYHFWGRVLSDYADNFQGASQIFGALLNLLSLLLLIGISVIYYFIYKNMGAINTISYFIGSMMLSRGVFSFLFINLRKLQDYDIYIFFIYFISLLAAPTFLALTAAEVINFK